MPAGVATVMILSTYPHFRMVRRPVCAHLRMRKRGKVALTVSECEMCGQARPALLVGGEADGVEQPGAAPAGRWAGGLWFGGLLGPRGDVGDDLLGHPVQQRQRTGHHPAGLVDVLDPGPDELGVADDRPHDVRALLQVGGDSREQRANPVEVERQSGDQQHDVDDGENNHRSHTVRGVVTSLEQCRTRRFTSSGMSALLDSVFACPGTACSLRLPLKQHCGSIAPTPGSCGTLLASNNRGGVQDGQAHRVTCCNAGNSPPRGGNMLGWRSAVRWCSSKRSETSTRPCGTASPVLTGGRAGAKPDATKGSVSSRSGPNTCAD